MRIPHHQKEISLTGTTDFGGKPFVLQVNEMAKLNQNFRSALWTGTHLQLTLMSLLPFEEIGLEMHPHVDQIIRVEEGYGIVQFGQTKDACDMQWHVCENSMIFIPAGTWHNVINSCPYPLKLTSIYAPPNHPFGTVQSCKPMND